MNKIIIIGRNGQLARALGRRADAAGFDIAQIIGSDDQDLSAPEGEVKRFLSTLPKADGVINAAAYTQVDNAETNELAAHAVNAVAPRLLADECAKRNIPLIHVSTDYVFDGTNDTPWKPSDVTSPINMYGKTKLGGELAIVNSAARAAILRTSWVYDGTGKNFLQTMLRLAKERTELGVVHDQIGRPTYAGHLAEACLISLKKLIAEPEFNGGIYHVSNTGEPLSWAEFAEAIFDKAAAHIPHKMSVNKIPASAYPTPAKRPAYSVMDTSKFEKTFKYNIPPWADGLEAAYKEWLSHQNIGCSNDTK